MIPSWWGPDRLGIESSGSGMAMPVCVFARPVRVGTRICPKAHSRRADAIGSRALGLPLRGGTE